LLDQLRDDLEFGPDIQDEAAQLNADHQKWFDLYSLLRERLWKHDSETIGSPLNLRLVDRPARLFRGEEFVQLTPQQFRVLRIVLNSNDGTCTDGDLRPAWGYANPNKTVRHNTVETAISRLNNRLKPLKVYVKQISRLDTEFTASAPTSLRGWQISQADDALN
jgi:hypothetical protein